MDEDYRNLDEIHYVGIVESIHIIKIRKVGYY